MKKRILALLLVLTLLVLGGCTVQSLTTQGVRENFQTYGLVYD